MELPQRASSTIRSKSGYESHIRVSFRVVKFCFIVPDTITHSKRDLEIVQIKNGGVMSSQVSVRESCEEGSGSLAEEAGLGLSQRTRQLGSA